MKKMLLAALAVLALPSGATGRSRQPVEALPPGQGRPRPRRRRLPREAGADDRRPRQADRRRAGPGRRYRRPGQLRKPGRRLRPGPARIRPLRSVLIVPAHPDRPQPRLGPRGPQRAGPRCRRARPEPGARLPLLPERPDGDRLRRRLGRGPPQDRARLLPSLAVFLGDLGARDRGDLRKPRKRPRRVPGRGRPQAPENDRPRGALRVPGRAAGRRRPEGLVLRAGPDREPVRRDPFRRGRRSPEGPRGPPPSRGGPARGEEDRGPFLPGLRRSDLRARLRPRALDGRPAEDRRDEEAPHPRVQGTAGRRRGQGVRPPRLLFQQGGLLRPGPRRRSRRPRCDRHRPRGVSGPGPGRSRQPARPGNGRGLLSDRPAGFRDREPQGPGRAGPRRRERPRPPTSSRRASSSSRRSVPERGSSRSCPRPSASPRPSSSTAPIPPGSTRPFPISPGRSPTSPITARGTLSWPTWPRTSTSSSPARRAPPRPSS